MSHGQNSFDIHDKIECVNIQVNETVDPGFDVHDTKHVLNIHDSFEKVNINVPKEFNPNISVYDSSNTIEISDRTEEVVLEVNEELCPQISVVDGMFNLQQSDWDQNLTNKPDYIKNKPTKLSQFINDINFPFYNQKTITSDYTVTINDQNYVLNIDSQNDINITLDEFLLDQDTQLQIIFNRVNTGEVNFIDSSSNPYDEMDSIDENGIILQIYDGSKWKQISGSGSGTKSKVIEINGNFTLTKKDHEGKWIRVNSEAFEVIEITVPSLPKDSEFIFENVGLGTLHFIQDGVSIQHSSLSLPTITGFNRVQMIKVINSSVVSLTGALDDA